MIEGPNNPKNAGPTRNSPRTSRREFFSISAKIVTALALGGELFLRYPDIVRYIKDLEEYAAFRRSDDFHVLSVSERESHIRIEIARAQEFLRTPDIRRLLHEGTDDELFMVLDSLPKILWEHIRGTTLDIPEEEWPSVGISDGSTHTGLNVVFSNEPLDTKASLGAANAVFIAPDRLLTAAHALDESSYGNEHTAAVLREQFKKSGIDAAFVEISNADVFDLASRAKILPLTNKSDRELYAELVVIPSLDVDETASAEGKKLTVSLLIPATDRILDFLEQHTGFPQGLRTTARKCLIVITPPAEVAQRRSDSVTGSRVLDVLTGRNVSDTRSRSRGTSGAPALHEGEIVGPVALGKDVTFGGVSLGFGFVTGPDAVRVALSIGMLIKTTVLTDQP